MANILENFKKNVVKKTIFKKLEQIVKDMFKLKISDLTDFVYLEIDINQDDSKNIFLIVEKRKIKLEIDLNSISFLQGYLQKSKQKIKNIFMRIDMKNQNANIKMTYIDNSTEIINF